MKKRKGLTVKINPPTNVSSPKNGSEAFHEAFPIKLTHIDNGVEKICYFVCKEHLQSYISRYKLKKDEVKIEKTLPQIGENKNGIK
jgi:hypothetical protein